MTSINISETIKQIPPQEETVKKSTIESSVQLRSNSLQNPTKQALPSEPDPKLKSLCANMDHKSLRDHIYDTPFTPQALAASLTFAPDPASLVLESIHGFYPFDNVRRWAKAKMRRIKFREGNMQHVMRNCIKLLEGLYLIGGDFKERIEGVKEKAKEVAVEWKRKMYGSGNDVLRVMGFLQLVASYWLVTEFEVDEIMELFVCACKRKLAIGLIKPLGLEDRCHVLVEKLNSQGRQVDAVKIVYISNLVDKYPPVPLLKAFANEAKDKTHKRQIKGNHSLQAMNEAAAKEIAALRSVLVVIDEHKLDGEYLCEEILRRIAQLEEQMSAKKKQATTSKATPKKQKSKKRAASNTREKKQQQQQPNKRSCPSPAVPATPYYPPFIIQSQTQLGLNDRARAPCMNVPGPFGAALGYPSAHMYRPIRGQGVSSLSAAQLAGLGGPRPSPPPPRSYYHSVGSLACTNNLPPPVYERPVAYHGYDCVSNRQPLPYSSSLYRFRPPPYGSSLYR